VVWRLTKRGTVKQDERVTFTESVIAAQTFSPFETETAELAQTQATEVNPEEQP